MILASLSGSRRLRRVLAPSLRRAAQTPGADRSRKHVPVSAHLWILLLHGLSASPSQPQTDALLATPRRFARLGLGQGLCQSAASPSGVCGDGDPTGAGQPHA